MTEKIIAFIFGLFLLGGGTISAGLGVFFLQKAFGLV